MGQREVAGVTQLVSRVERALRPQASLGQMLATTLPGGSVTGASKIAAPRAHLWVGGGIVCDSEPEAEIEESWIERPLLAAVGGLVAA
jgi:anthranilate/para-aminobenzoate synthase component I